MISGMVILNEPEKYCYPYLESIKSFLPVCDEIVVVHNPYTDDGSREKLMNLDPKVRVVSGVFDLRNIGWISYGIMRTTGYQAAKGDVILMFDADGVLHENDVERLKQRCNEIPNMQEVYGYWGKFRFYKPTHYRRQNKHSGWYNKGKLGDRFDFYNTNGKGIPNHQYMRPDEEKARQLDIDLWGYEHTFDTKEILLERAVNYGRMVSKQKGSEILADKEYWKMYIEDREEESKQYLPMDLDKHPEIMEERLNNLNETHFGYNFFGEF